MISRAPSVTGNLRRISDRRIESVVARHSRIRSRKRLRFRSARFLNRLTIDQSRMESVARENSSVKLPAESGCQKLRLKLAKRAGGPTNSKKSSSDGGVLRAIIAAC